MPAILANSSICFICLSRAVMLMRTGRSVFGSIRTRNATASFLAGSSAHASSEDGSGTVFAVFRHADNVQFQSLSRDRCASSRVFPAVIQSGKSGKLTPKSEFRSLCKYAIYSITLSLFPESPDYPSLIPACFSMLLRTPIGIFGFGCGAVTRPFFSECFNYK